MSAILLRNGPSNIIFFGCRDPIRSTLPDSLNQFGLLADFLSGACLGAFISTIFYPLNTTKTHMQVKQWSFAFKLNLKNKDNLFGYFQASLGGEFRSFRSVFLTLLKERGAAGMFRGVHVNYTRCDCLVVSWFFSKTYPFL